MTHPHDLTCRELADFIAGYLDRTLPPATAQEFERHLSICPSCVHYLDSYKRAVALGRDAMQPLEAPAAAIAPKAILEAIRAAKNATR